MNRIAIVGIALFAIAGHATQVCGLYRLEDFGDRTINSVIDFHSYPGLSTTYTIVNPKDKVVRDMVSSSCYCVEGIISVDLDFGGDTMYQRLRILRLNLGPFNDCEPTLAAH